jgi:hypothetical protein
MDFEKPKTTYNWNGVGTPYTSNKIMEEKHLGSGTVGLTYRYHQYIVSSRKGLFHYGLRLKSSNYF